MSVLRPEHRPSRLAWRIQPARHTAPLGWLRVRFEHRSETLALENEEPTGPRRPVLLVARSESEGGVTQYEC